jgi:hypothetical protein
VEELEQRTHELGMLGEMSELFHACETLEDEKA